MCIQHLLSKNVCTAGRLNCTQTLHHLVDYLFVCDRILACPFNEQVFLILIFFFYIFQFHACSVGEQEDIQGLALETDCLPRYVAKGIALGCFVYGRCLHHGLGVEQNREQAKHWYSRVGVLVC